MSGSALNSEQLFLCSSCFFSTTSERLRLGVKIFTYQKSAGVGTSLAVQWLRLGASTAEGMGSIPGWGTRSHIPRIPHAVRPKKCAGHGEVWGDRDGFFFF